MKGDNGYSKMWTWPEHGQHWPQGGRLIEDGRETLKCSVHSAFRNLKLLRCLKPLSSSSDYSVSQPAPESH